MKKPSHRQHKLLVQYLQNRLEAKLQKNKTLKRSWFLVFLFLCILSLVWLVLQKVPLPKQNFKAASLPKDFSILSQNQEGACVLNTALKLQKVIVTYVIDGDTLILSSGVHVRLKEINASELKSKEPFAKEATYFLRDWVKQHQVFLLMASEKNDRYGRALAWVFDEERKSAEADLVQNGMALVMSKGSQLLLPCLLRLEKKARENRKGLWSRKDFFIQRSSATQLRKGYTLVRGRVSHFRKYRHRVDAPDGFGKQTPFYRYRITLGKSLKLQVSLPQNKEPKLNQMIEARGYLRVQPSNSFMRVEDLRLINPVKGEAHGIK